MCANIMQLLMIIFSDNDSDNKKCLVIYELQVENTVIAHQEK